MRRLAPLVDKWSKAEDPCDGRLVSSWMRFHVKVDVVECQLRLVETTPRQCCRPDPQQCLVLEHSGLFWEDDAGDALSNETALWLPGQSDAALRQRLLTGRRPSRAGNLFQRQAAEWGLEIPRQFWKHGSAECLERGAPWRHHLCGL